MVNLKSRNYILTSICTLIMFSVTAVIGLFPLLFIFAPIIWGAVYKLITYIQSKRMTKNKNKLEHH